MAWHDDLDSSSPAYSIAAYPGSPLRVLAGPGTGKTFALMRRVARLLEEGAKPERIMVVTFTRTAAYDLEQELKKLAVPGVDRIVHGTLHSYCFSVLVKDRVFDITRRVARPLLDFEERFLVEDLNHKERFGDVHERKQHIEALAAAWAREQEDVPGVLGDTDRLVQEQLLRWLEFHDALLLAELVPLTLRYLTSNPGRADRYQFDHVLVDEYQDWNVAEQHLIDLLSENGTLTVVGDEDQSIYEDFRYAHPEGISQFHITHLNTHDEPLEECRRCPTRVVALANALIRHNTRRTPRNLLARPSNVDGDIHLVQWDDLEAETEGIAEYIHEKVVVRKEFAPGNVLVLSPARELGYRLRDTLCQRGVLARSFFTEQLFDGTPRDLSRCQAQEAFTLLTLLADPRDKVALRCYLGFGHNSLQARAYARLRTHCSQNGEELSAALERLSNDNLKIPHASGLVARYQELRHRLEELKDKTGREVLDCLFPVGEEWAEPFRTLAEVNESEDSSEVMTPQKILQTLRARIIHPEIPMEVPYVRVMSLHKSKGLTADHVIVIGCIEGLIPRHPKPWYPFERQQRYREEQRRLFYVAITRPRKTLVLSSFSQIPRDIANTLQVSVGRGNRTTAATITSTFISDLLPLTSRPVSGDKWRY